MLYKLICDLVLIKPLVIIYNLLQMVLIRKLLQSRLYLLNVSEGEEEVLALNYEGVASCCRELCGATDQSLSCLRQRPCCNFSVTRVRPNLLRQPTVTSRVPPLSRGS